MPYLPTVNVRGLCPRAGLNEKDPAESQVPEDIHWSGLAIQIRIFAGAEFRVRSRCCQSDRFEARLRTLRKRSASCSSRSFPSSLASSSIRSTVGLSLGSPQ
jgi:hypothetical protein